MLAGCLPQATPLPPLPTDTPLPPTASPTATIVWFPPTATFTPLPPVTPVLTPTLDTRPGYGAPIFSDDFSKPELWALGRTAAGSAALGQSELTLVVSQPRGYLFSLRQETALNDFYLEITASPSICRGADEYGLLLRLVSLQDFLRFGLTCRGEARLDRLSGGDASSPYPPEISGAVPPGAPSTVPAGGVGAGQGAALLRQRPVPVHRERPSAASRRAGRVRPRQRGRLGDGQFLRPGRLPGQKVILCQDPSATG